MTSPSNLQLPSRVYNTGAGRNLGSCKGAWIARLRRWSALAFERKGEYGMAAESWPYAGEQTSQVVSKRACRTQVRQLDSEMTA